MASLAQIGHLFLSIFQKCPEKFARTHIRKTNCDENALISKKITNN